MWKSLGVFVLGEVIFLKFGSRDSLLVRPPLVRLKYLKFLVPTEWILLTLVITLTCVVLSEMPQQPLKRLPWTSDIPVPHRMNYNNYCNNSVCTIKSCKGIQPICFHGTFAVFELRGTWFGCMLLQGTNPFLFPGCQIPTLCHNSCWYTGQHWCCVLCEEWICLAVEIKYQQAFSRIADYTFNLYTHLEVAQFAFSLYSRWFYHIEIHLHMK